MKEIGIYTSIAISIMGVAYPIILQVISTLDEKYSSIKIVELFDAEHEKKGFQYLLISSLIAVALWSFQFPPLIFIEEIDYFISNSAAFFLIASSVLLVIYFFLLIDKIFIYLTPIKFVKYLIQKHQVDIDELKYFKSLTDVFLKSIQEQNHNLSETISRFLYEDFKQRRAIFVNIPVEYPDAYYSIVYKSIEELAILKDKKNIPLEYRTSGGVWLLGETAGFEISEKTYNWLWYNILLAVKYEQDDMVLYHWERAHQYIKFSLRRLQPEHNEQFEIINQSELDKREKERDRFVDFHYALGGLLLYKKRYSCIKRMFNYTTSEPPRYELLPETMTDIFVSFMKYNDRYSNHWISRRYPFPEMEGIKADAFTVKWISSYFALLVLRQYIIFPYITTPLANPILPKNQADKINWIDMLDFFKRLIAEHLENEELLSLMKFTFLTRDWCVIQNKAFPLDFIDSLKLELETKYKEGAINLEVSAKKKKQFVDVSRDILEQALAKFSEVINGQAIKGDTNKLYIYGTRMIESKDAFTENPEAHHIDFDSFLATKLSKEVINGVAFTFFISRSKSYLFKPKDLFPAIDKLTLTLDYVIIVFGIDFNTNINYQNYPGLATEHYKGITLLKLPNTLSVNNSIFILAKESLPIIKTLTLDEATIKKYALSTISDKYKLYGSALDLNLVDDEIRTENLHLKNDEELRKSVLLNLLFKIEIEWLKNVNLIYIQEYSEYRQDGEPSELSDVTAIE